mmetsp:Transcript_36890/g.56472  ORF Transcript_36890/g.56472 Transcript_36890/m.56472 type:complete len:130 (+) Transcript_36890:941-1330(+)
MRRAPPPFYNAAASFVSQGAHGLDETKKSHDQVPETPNIDSSKKSPKSALMGGRLKDSSVFNNKTRKLLLPTNIQQNEGQYSRSKQREAEVEQPKFRTLDKELLAVPLTSQKSDCPVKSSLPPQNPLLG